MTACDLEKFFTFDNKSSQGHLGGAASPHLTAENGLAHCIC